MDYRFIKYPNLPKYRVKAVLLGEIYTDLENALGKRGISSIRVPKNSSVPSPVAYHADMTVCHLGGNKLLIARDVNFDDSRFEITKSTLLQTQVYPNDVNLNVCSLGTLIFHKVNCTDPYILNGALGQDAQFVNINQGYAKCSVCVVDEYHIITSDSGIHKAAGKNGIESLLISPGQIELTGYGSGFIGGASGKISENEVAFTGSLSGHSDEKRILDFIKRAGKEPVFLSSEPIYDVGSILPVIESAE